MGFSIICAVLVTLLGLNNKNIWCTRPAIWLPPVSCRSTAHYLIISAERALVAVLALDNRSICCTSRAILLPPVRCRSTAHYSIISAERTVLAAVVFSIIGAVLVAVLPLGNKNICCTWRAIWLPHVCAPVMMRRKNTNNANKSKLQLCFR